MTAGQNERRGIESRWAEMHRVASFPPGMVLFLEFQQVCPEHVNFTITTLTATLILLLPQHSWPYREMAKMQIEMIQLCQAAKKRRNQLKSLLEESKHREVYPSSGKQVFTKRTTI